LFNKLLIANRGKISCRVIRTAGVQAIFGPGTNLADAADEVLRLLGHNRPPLDEAAE
jgi:methylmalonyl-CoA mutase